MIDQAKLNPFLARFLDCCHYQVRKDGRFDFKGYDGMELEKLRRDIEVQCIGIGKVVQPEDQMKELIGGQNKQGDKLYVPDGAGQK